MSFTSIPNQPILFHSQEEILAPCIECGDSNYKQLIDFSDKVFFQVESTPCIQVPMEPFYTQLYQWTNEDGIICGDGILDGLYSQFLYIDYVYQLYSVTFTILNVDEGSIDVRLNGCATQTLNLAGTYTLYFNNPTIIDGVYVDLIFQSDATFKGCFDLDSIIVKGIPSKNQMKLGIVDANTLEQLDVIQAQYGVIGNKIIGSFDFINIDVSEGCYRLAIADFCENTCNQFRLRNNLFNSLAGSVYAWGSGSEYGGVVTLTQNNANIDLSVQDSDAYLYNINSQFCTGKYYYISLVIESTGNPNIYISIGDITTQLTSVNGYVTTGMFAGDPVSFYGTNLIITAYQNGNEQGMIDIKKIDVQIDDGSIQWNKYSDIIDLSDYSDSCKYFKIEGCNTQEQFNLAFNYNSFMPMVRLEGRKAKPQYETNANTFRYASGKWNANYVNRLKQWTYSFGRLPEYILDFLSTIFYYDNCYVNGVLMFPQDKSFPTIDWSDADTYLGSFSIDLIEKYNKVVKVQCTDSNATCLPSVVETDEPFLLTEDGIILNTEDSINLYYEN